MPGIQTIRLVLALTALVLFGLGVRSESSYLRFAGIAFLTASLALRFVGRGTPKG